MPPDPALTLDPVVTTSRLSGADTSGVALQDARQRIPVPGFLEVFRRGSLSVELYCPRHHDPQTPHTQDELYVVISGSGQFFCTGERRAFGPGDLLFVAAGQEHRFEAFSDDLALWVIFYGPDGGERAPERTVLGQMFAERGSV